MPSYSSRRNYNDNRKGNSNNNNNRFGGQRPRRDDRKNQEQRRPVLSPWESGITPGAGASLLGSYNQNQAANAFLIGAAMARNDYPATNYNAFGAANKIRRLDRMGGFDDHRGRGLLPSPPSGPLLGVAPPSFSPQTRGPENFQQRIGTPWGGSSMQSTSPKGLSSAYYPSKTQQDNNYRRYNKAKRSRPSSSSSSRSGIRDARDKLKSSSRKSSSRDKESDFKESKSKDSEGDSSLKSESTEKEIEPEINKEAEPSRKVVKEGEDESMEVESKDVDQHKKEDKSAETCEDNKGEKRKQTDDSFPAEALYCHICDLENFATKKGYIRHLEGITHSNMSETFHAKNAATLELMNISAKFSQMRRRDKLIRKSGKKGLPLGKIVENSLVERLLHPGSCCGEHFDSPYELEEHKLTIQHLLNIYEEKKEKPVKTDELPNAADESKLDEQIEEAKKKAEEEPLTIQNIPVYDSGTSIGLEFIDKRPFYHCNICKGEPFRSVKLHCLSYKHYDNVSAHLNKQEEKILEEKIEMEKKIEEAKKEEEKNNQDDDDDQLNGEGKGSDEKESKTLKCDIQDEIDDLDVNYSDDDMKSSPRKSIDNYIKEDDDEFGGIGPEDDPGEMIVLDEKEFENEDVQCQEASAESVLEETFAEAVPSPPKQEFSPPRKELRTRPTRTRSTRSSKTSFDDFAL